jgi:hypothetical protein
VFIRGTINYIKVESTIRHFGFSVVTMKTGWFATACMDIKKDERETFLIALIRRISCNEHICIIFPSTSKRCFKARKFKGA